MKSYKKKKNTDYTKMVADMGLNIDPNQYQYPWQQYNPNGNMQIYPQQEYTQMNAPAAQTDASGYIPNYAPTLQEPTQNTQSSQGMSNIGSMAAGIGRSAGQLLNGVVNGAPSFFNALLPKEQPRKNKYQPVSYNANSMGTGSQAIYEDGGSLKNTNDPTYNALSQVLMNRNRDKNFVDRAYNPQNYPIQGNNDGTYSTHKMAYDTNMDGTGMVYPTIVQKQNQQLEELSPNDAYNYAQENNEYIATPSWKMADYLSNRGYKNATGLDKKEDGGGVSPWLGDYTTLNTNRRKKNNISVTEEVPTDYIPSNNIQPLQQYNQNLSPNPQPIQIPNYTPQQQSQISFLPSYDAKGNLAEYRPQFSGFNRNDAINAMRDLPQSFGNTPVNTSPYTYGEEFQGFYPGEQNWQPYSDNTQQPYTVKQHRTLEDIANSQMYEFGGQLEAKNGIHIDPKNKGKFNALKKRTGKSTEELTHSKNPLTRKRAVFAQNAKKFKHEYGGYVEGAEVDLDPDTLQQLLAQGYQIEF